MYGWLSSTQSFPMVGAVIPKILDICCPWGNISIYFGKIKETQGKNVGKLFWVQFLGCQYRSKDTKTSLDATLPLSISTNVSGKQRLILGLRYVIELLISRKNFI